MPLHVGLTFNLKIDSPLMDKPEDWVAEHEETTTVDLIAAALTHLGHDVSLLPFDERFIDRLAARRPNIVFNIAEGWSGRNRESLVPAILEFMGIPYTGSDPLCLGLCLDKALCKCVVGAAGLPVLPSWVVETPQEAERLELPLPAFVKPNTEGSSKGIRGNSYVVCREELLQRIHWVTQVYRQPALVEPFLSGREFTIGLLGNPPVALPVLEVIPARAELLTEAFVYSFETKSRNLEKLLCPAPIDEREERRLQEMALAAHRAAGCRDVSRVDIRMDQTGHPFFLEINPLPGLSSCSLLPVQAAAAGISYESLVDAILMSACHRQNLTAAALANPA